jgi:hypothetical protein
MELTWEINFPRRYFTIYYNRDSNVGEQSFSNGVQSSLTQLRENQYIESVLSLELNSNDIGIPAVRCSVNNLPAEESSLNQLKGIVLASITKRGWRCHIIIMPV